METRKTSPRPSPRDLSESGSQTVSSLYFARPILAILVGASVFVAGLVLDPILSAILPGQWFAGQGDAGFAYVALVLVVLGLCILFFGATAVMVRKSGDLTDENFASPFTTLRTILSKGVYSRLLVLSTVLYAIFYSLASGIMVYDPNVSFSAVYRVSVPSLAVATCCSPLGQTPLAEVYLTEHVGLLLVPINLLLLFLISWLVGLNTAIGAFLFSRRATGSGWLGGVGAFVGLFTSCPTCAGLAIFSILGGTSALSTGLFLGPLQALFVGVSLPILVASPIILARSLRSNVAEACPV